LEEEIDGLKNEAKQLAVEVEELPGQVPYSILIFLRAFAASRESFCSFG
jgi:hypothetical protein